MNTEHNNLNPSDDKNTGRTPQSGDPLVALVPPVTPPPPTRPVLTTTRCAVIEDRSFNLYDTNVLTLINPTPGAQVPFARYNVRNVSGAAGAVQQTNQVQFGTIKYQPVAGGYAFALLPERPYTGYFMFGPNHGAPHIFEIAKAHQASVLAGQETSSVCTVGEPFARQDKATGGLLHLFNFAGSNQHVTIQVDYVMDAVPGDTPDAETNIPPNGQLRYGTVTYKQTDTFSNYCNGTFEPKNFTGYFVLTDVQYIDHQGALDAIKKHQQLA